jgi:hypothetical protein
VLLVAGVIAGSLSWVSLLASGIAVARRSVDPRALTVAEALAGLGLIAFGGVVLAGTAREH